MAVEQVRIPSVRNESRENKGSCQLGGNIETVDVNVKEMGGQIATQHAGLTLPRLPS